MFTQLISDFYRGHMVSLYKFWFSSLSFCDAIFYTLISRLKGNWSSTILEFQWTIIVIDCDVSVKQTTIFEMHFKYVERKSIVLQFSMNFYRIFENAQTGVPLFSTMIISGFYRVQDLICISFRWFDHDERRNVFSEKNWAPPAIPVAVPEQKFIRAPPLWFFVS